MARAVLSLASIINLEISNTSSVLGLWVYPYSPHFQLSDGL